MARGVFRAFCRQNGSGFFSEKNEKSQKDDAKANGLSHGKNSWNHKTAGVPTEEFNNEPGQRIEEQVIPKEFSPEPSLPSHGEQGDKNGEGGGRFVELGGMQWNVPRSQADRVGKSAGPRNIRGEPVTTPRRKASQPSYRLAQSDGRGD